MSAESCSQCSTCIDTDYDDTGGYDAEYVFSCGRCLEKRDDFLDVVTTNSGEQNNGK